MGQSDRVVEHAAPMFSSAVFGIDVPLIDERSAVQLLGQLGALDLRSMLDQEITVRDVSRRCRCLIVQGPETAWVVKQGANAETLESVANEARAYRALIDTPLTASIPRYRFHDPATGVLIIEFVEGLTPQEHEIGRPPRDRAQYAYELGGLLAQVHRLPLNGFASQLPPRVLSCHRPSLESIEFHSAASLRALAIVQRNAQLSAALDSVRDDWTPTAFSHNDLRGDNIIVRERTGKIAIIDWEMASISDPRWDLSALLAERLVGWLNDPELWLSDSESGGHAAAVTGLTHLHLFTRFLLAGYTQGSNIEASPFTPTAGTPAARWIAARLVQAAIEHCHQQALISPLAEQILQIAANMSARPAEAARFFFGTEI